MYVYIFYDKLFCAFSVRLFKLFFVFSVSKQYIYIYIFNILAFSFFYSAKMYKERKTQRVQGCGVISLVSTWISFRK